MKSWKVMSNNETAENIRVDESDGWYWGYWGKEIKGKKDRTQKNYRLWQREKENSKDRKHGNQSPAENKPIISWLKLNSPLRIIAHINAWLDKDHMSEAQWPFSFTNSESEWFIWAVRFDCPTDLKTHAHKWPTLLK